jgi:hypothetical protein
MDVVGFLSVSLGSNTVQLHDRQIADEHVYVQKLVSVVKTAIVLEECITEEQRSVVRFCGQKDSKQRIFIKKYFLFTVVSVCRVKRFITESINSLKDVRKLQMMTNQLRK